jgi:GNAT superfamily N-acetyltransferase
VLFNRFSLESLFCFLARYNYDRWPMMTPFVLQQAAEHDLPAIAHLAEQADPQEWCDYESADPQELLRFDRGVAAAGSQATRWVARSSTGQVIGTALQFAVPWTIRQHLHWAVIRVEPPFRRQGVGRALLAACRAQMHNQNGQTLALELRLCLEPLLARAAADGLSEAFRSIPFGLNPQHADLAALAPAAARAAAHAVQITTLPVLQAEDPAWLSKLHQLYHQILREVPIPERPTFDPPQLAEYLAALPDACFVAVREQQYLGLSFMLPGSEPNTLLQKLTGVATEARGQGVAKALKLATLEYARQQQVEQIITWIETNNPAMLHLSDRLGFRQLEDGIIVLEGR